MNTEKNSGIDYSIAAGLKIVEDFDLLDLFAFGDIAAFLDDEAGRTEAVARDIIFKSKQLGLDWYVTKYLLEYIQNEQVLRSKDEMSSLGVVQSAFWIVEFFGLGRLEMLRLVGLLSTYSLVKIWIEFVRAFRKKLGQRLGRCEIKKMILHSEKGRGLALEVFHSRFLIC